MVYWGCNRYLFKYIWIVLRIYNCIFFEQSNSILFFPKINPLYFINSTGYLNAFLKENSNSRVIVLKKEFILMIYNFYIFYNFFLQHRPFLFPLCKNSSMRSLFLSKLTSSIFTLLYITN
ncbi:hypothetical protein H312_02972 [Anncaliia algerae PRA339]|uniref:Uncharacterized protein n=1 Tax=Anncaliia algerae PRA339 TaxID=1288291 RepID=A0A059EXQ2_9MICR|nr:hypothetical protein H312_02972 [Anncaliia algerae PRA339]